MEKAIEVQYTRAASSWTFLDYLRLEADLDAFILSKYNVKAVHRVVKRPRNFSNSFAKIATRRALMKRFYDKFRPGDNKTIVSMPEEKNGNRPAPAVKSRTPTEPNAQTVFDPQSASLEGLALELQQQILQRLTDLPSLDALVHASPLYHRAYLNQRQSTLAKVVSQDIGPDTLFEAHAVAMALTINNKDGSEIRRFLEDYQSTRTESASISIERFPLMRIAILSRLQYAVRFASTDFCQATLSRHPLSSEKEADTQPLSTNESRRISRAFYRFEIFCRIFSQAGFRVKPKLDCMDMCHLFLNQFPPWEVEEIACIRDYMIGRYAQLFAKHEHKLVQIIPQGAPEDSSGDERPFEGNMTGHISSFQLS